MTSFRPLLSTELDDDSVKNLLNMNDGRRSQLRPSICQEWQRHRNGRKSVMSSDHYILNSKFRGDIKENAPEPNLTRAMTMNGSFEANEMVGLSM
ncbi:unnamed protein product [Soboliphyme baturini]|uniref:Uncharacterized protein n=1 Tax=Soboliphyme baturini TaxID=241478 RepID=A0A183J0Z5_9BILA|nr:unnamed protein product [Soboliphyme baturini]